MAFDGAGNFVRLYSWQDDRDNSVKISAVRMDAEFDGIATALSQCYVKDGQAAMTGDVRMGGNDVTGLGSGTLSLPSLAFAASVNSGVYWSGTAVGIINAGTARLLATTTGVDVAGTFSATGTATLPTIDYTTGVALQYGGATKLATTTTGVTVTGTAVIATINNATGVALQYGGATKLATTTTGATLTGTLDATTINNAAGVVLQYGGSTRISATSAGASVTGTLGVSGAFTASSTASITSTLTVPTINNATGVAIQYNGSTTLATVSGGASVTGTLAVSGKLTTAASAVGGAGLNLPHGTAPTSPVNGDIWTTTSGLSARINGATVTYGSVALTEANSGISIGTNSSGTAGLRNTTLGNGAGNAMVSGSNDNVAVGYQALDAVSTSSSGNVAAGSGAGGGLTTGAGCVFVGYNSGLSVTTGGENVAVGYQALSNGVTSVSRVVAIGYNAGRYFAGATNNSIAIGHSALSGSTNTGIDNIGIGYRTGQAITTGSRNVTIGTDVALSTAASNDNVIIGSYAMDNVSTSISDSVIIGSNAFGAASAGGSGNVIIGKDAVGGSGSLGGSMVIIGYQAGLVSAASGTIMIGAQAGQTATARNILIGNGCGSSITTGAENIILGANAGSAALSNTFIVSRLDNGAVKIQHDNVDFFIPLHGTTASGANAYIDSATGAVRRSTSSIRYKKDVVPIEREWAFKVLQFDGIFYKSKCRGDNPGHSYYGFSAEQVAEIDPRHISTWEYADEDLRDKNGLMVPRANATPLPGGVSYDRITVAHNEIIKELLERIENLEARLAA